MNEYDNQRIEKIEDRLEKKMNYIDDRIWSIWYWMIGIFCFNIVVNIFTHIIK